MIARTSLSLFLALTFAFFALPGAGFAADAKNPPMIFTTDVSGGDLKFLSSAAEQGLLLATLGVLAADHAKSSEVKDYGQALAKNHATQNERIKLLTIRKGITTPSAGLTKKQNKIADELSKLEGLKFDKAYLEEMVQELQVYAATFELATQSRDPEIKSFATLALPNVKKDLALVRQMTGMAAPASEAAPHFRVNASGTDKQQ